MLSAASVAMAMWSHPTRRGCLQPESLPQQHSGLVHGSLTRLEQQQALALQTLNDRLLMDDSGER